VAIVAIVAVAYIVTGPDPHRLTDHRAPRCGGDRHRLRRRREVHSPDREPRPRRGVVGVLIAVVLLARLA
jgi:hypothetical protein